MEQRSLGLRDVGPVTLASWQGSQGDADRSRGAVAIELDLGERRQRLRFVGLCRREAGLREIALTVGDDGCGDRDQQRDGDGCEPDIPPPREPPCLADVFADQFVLRDAPQRRRQFGYQVAEPRISQRGLARRARPARLYPARLVLEPANERSW